MAGFGSLYVGASGLNSSQNALNATAHNLANVDTKGYVRQQVLQANKRYNSVGNAAVSDLQVGLGVDLATIRQVRDFFGDQQYRKENGHQKFYQSGFDTLSEIQDYFGELEGVQFGESIEGLSESVQEIAKHVDIVNKTAFKEKALYFIDRASAVYEGLKSYQLNQNQKIKQGIDNINNIAKQIDVLNDQIQRVESGMEKANDLRDRRDNLLDELSGYINIEYKEQANGRVTVQAEGVPLVTDTGYDKMGYRTDDATGFVIPTWSLYNNRDVYDFSQPIKVMSANDVGSLKAQVLARGTKVGKYTDIPSREDFTGAAAEADYLKAVDEYNKNIEPSSIMNTQAELDRFVHSLVTKINDVLCPNKEFIAQDGTKYTILDEEKAGNGSDADKTKGTELFSRIGMPRYEKKTITGTDGQPHTVMVYNKEDPTNRDSLYSIENLRINQAVLDDPNLIPLNRRENEEALDIAAQLADIWSKDFDTINPNNATKYKINGFYEALVVSEIGAKGQVYGSFADTLNTSRISIDNKRLQTTGVSSDEELSNMIKFQNAYNASARYINVIDEMLEHLVTNL